MTILTIDYLVKNYDVERNELEELFNKQEATLHQTLIMNNELSTAFDYEQLYLEALKLTEKHVINNYQQRDR